MPATEKTWYSQRLLHVVFGFTSLLLLISTLWMFAADEKREWKGYQRDFREAEQRLTKWRIAEVESATHQDQLQDLNGQLLAARNKAPDAAIYQAFKSQVHAEASRTGKEPRNFDSLDAAHAKLVELSGDLAALDSAAEAAAAEESAAAASLAAAKADFASMEQPDKAQRKVAEQAIRVAENHLKEATNAASDARAEAETMAKKLATQRDASFIDPLGKILKSAKDREIELSRQRKFISADNDAAKANLGLAVRDGKPQAVLDGIQQQIDEINNAVPGGLKAVTLERQAATAHRKLLQDILAGMRATRSS